MNHKKSVSWKRIILASAATSLANLHFWLVFILTRWQQSRWTLQSELPEVQICQIGPVILGRASVGQLMVNLKQSSWYLLWVLC